MILEQKLIANLNKKLETLVLHLKDLKFDKKRANSSFKEQMDECEHKIQTIAETLKSGDHTFLTNAFDEYEIEVLSK